MDRWPWSDTETTQASNAIAALLIIGFTCLAVFSLGLTYMYSSTPQDSLLSENGPQLPDDIPTYDTPAEAGARHGPADDVYLTTDGGAILVYENSLNDTQSPVRRSVTAATALTELTTELAGQDRETEGTEIPVTPAQLADGEQVLDQPTPGSTLDLDVSGEFSQDTNEFEAALSATGPTEHMEERLSGSTNGEIRLTPDAITTTGTATSTSSTTGTPRYLSVSVAESESTDGEYRMHIERRTRIDSSAVSRWQTRANASETLETEFASIAARFGGESSVELEQYALVAEETASNTTTDSNQTAASTTAQSDYELDLEFTVTYTGLNEGIERALSTTLTGSDGAATEGIQRSTPENERVLTTALAELEIETAEFTQETTPIQTDQGTGQTTRTDWNVELANYERALRAIIEPERLERESSNANGTDTETNLQARLDAQREADLQTVLEWNAEGETTRNQAHDTSTRGQSNRRYDVTATITGATENWSDYVDERTARGLDSRADTAFDLEITADRSAIDLEGEFELPRATVANRTADYLAKSVQFDPLGGSDGAAFVSALDEWNLDLTRTNVELDGETIRVHGGATFENLGALLDQLIPTNKQDDGVGKTYVAVDDLGDAAPENADALDTEALVDLPIVDEQTDVYEVGSWDEANGE
ncbi:hypothetical protein [Natrialba asiatica]|uniref:Uncharacterized protein n=1 Tax=Natrialba asiatica (strain ATCC 700177 / DSM 12278 / JCM 9576 / FERM P-10747 / NBRC 102637 / 172P1) TaxID=29540 RepID=M0AWG4_NATA1|nr:hypothetical protein [Natrialba asiatica]ELZ01749.1 hypothetical protein C481_09522 [Natrialba asiatica DSM 12278]